MTYLSEVFFFFHFWKRATILNGLFFRRTADSSFFATILKPATVYPHHLKVLYITFVGVQDSKHSKFPPKFKRYPYFCKFSLMSSDYLCFVYRPRWTLTVFLGQQWENGNRSIILQHFQFFDKYMLACWIGIKISPYLG